MKSQNRVEAFFFARKLLSWYSRKKRDLPWRKTGNPYKIWISEVMLQQTPVASVIPYYTKWVQLFPDVFSLGSQPLQKVLKAWQGLGYYQRAKNLHCAAKEIVERFNGEIPRDYETLRKLPGFGSYTTAAVLSLAFNKPYLVIDANVRRILMRLRGLGKEANPSADSELEKWVAPYLPSEKMGLVNQAMMELGALVCRPKNPQCLLCPLANDCKAFKKGEQEVIPVPKKRSYKKIDGVVAIITDEGKYLIQKRPAKGLFADLWEFPGGKRKQGESLEEALNREIKEELGVDVEVKEFLTKVRHSYTQYKVILYAFQCRLNFRKIHPRNSWRWVSLHGLHRYPFPSGSAKIIQFLQEKGNRKIKKIINRG